MRKIFLASVVMLISLSAFSQFHIGAYLGANFTNVNMSSPELNADTRAGYQGGAFFRAGKLLYGQAGAEYQMVKTNFSTFDSSDVLSNSGDVKFHVINIPLYAGINLLPVTDRIVNVRVFAGPHISMILDVPVNELDFTKDDFQTVKVNGAVGAGVDILLFSVDVGYNFGVNNLFTDTYDGKSHYAFVNAGIKF